jgi:hypothetical protein
MLNEQKKREFVGLYTEFARDYLPTPHGQRLLDSHSTVRAEGQENFRRIKEKADRGDIPTDEVLRRLLPHTDSAAHRHAGAWVHFAPAIYGDIKNFFEAAG